MVESARGALNAFTEVRERILRGHSRKEEPSDAMPTLWGFPVVLSERLPRGQVQFGDLGGLLFDENAQRVLEMLLAGKATAIFVAEDGKRFKLQTALVPEDDATRPGHLECCERSNHQLITGGSGSGGRQNVTVCRSCGIFSVSADQNGEHISLKFRLWDSELLWIAASQGHRRMRTGELAPTGRTWKPLDFAHQRLYHVILNYAEITKEGDKPDRERHRTLHYTVAASAPRHAASLIEDIYRDEFNARKEAGDIAWWNAQGRPLNVYQPVDWRENGIWLLNDELLEALEKHMDNCFGCSHDQPAAEANETLQISAGDPLPCDTCQLLNSLTFIRHNRAIEDDAAAKGPQRP